MRHVLHDYRRVQGGDINEAWCLQSGNQKYFLKLNATTRFPGMLEKEAGGLEDLRPNSLLRIPQVIQYGILEGLQWLLLEWLEKQAPDIPAAAAEFGARLAGLHRHSASHFGWRYDNYIGSLPQSNICCTQWADFYRHCRIMPLVDQLFREGIFSQKDREAAISLCEKAADIFPPEPPALLHGDLWAGNYMVVAGGRTAIFDPAIYYGHREMELGMTKLFGGFPAGFYDAYTETWPLEKKWQQRLPFSQLYPVLVHARLFGGHYIHSAREIIKRFGNRR